MSNIQEAFELLENELESDQRIWLMERNRSGSWGVAVVRDLPESEWPEPNEYGITPDSDRYITFAYRREETLLDALVKVRNDVVVWNQERRDKQAEEQFVKPITRDHVRDIANAQQGKK